MTHDAATAAPHSQDALWFSVWGWRSGWRLRWRVALALGSAVLSCAIARGEDAPGCKLGASMGEARVQAAIDGRTLLLADGRELRLAGLEILREQPTKAELGHLAAGKDIELRPLGATSDRYGRLVAVALPKGSPRPAASGIAQSIQYVLLTQGQALTAAKIGDTACAAAFWAAEKMARQGRLGLWADPRYVILNAEDPAAVLARRGRFALVEGQVVSARRAGATFYIDFGRRWSEDFTVTVSRRDERMFAAFGRDLTKLAGRNVRIRGVVEERGGPWIEATRPEQIELTETE